MTPEQREEWGRRMSALERENARLRQLLDDIHRGKAPAPPAPKRYDSATVAK